MRRYVRHSLRSPKVRVGSISKGYRGTRETVQRVKELIRTGAQDFYVRQKAIDILFRAKVSPKDYLGEIRALFKWVQQNIRYTRDPFRVEVLHSARQLLNLRAGDCDDMTTLLGSMLESIGHPIRLVLTGPNERRPNLFTHIYLEVNYRGRWIALDATMPYAMGWSPDTPVRRVFAMKSPQAMQQIGHVSTVAAYRQACACNRSHPRY